MHAILEMTRYLMPLAIKAGRVHKRLLNTDSEAPAVAEADYDRLSDWRATLRTFLRASQSLVRTAGITPQQYQALLVLRPATRMDAGGMTVTQLANLLQVRHNTAVSLVNRLVKSAYVRRGVHPTDRRRALLTLTLKGERLLRQLVHAHNHELNRIAPAVRKVLP